VSTVTITPGDLVIFDPSDKRTIVFDFDQLNLPVGVTLTSYALTIAPLIQTGVTALTKDNDALMAGNRKVIARFLATTATVGDRYQISVKGITSEAPVQEKEYSIFLAVEQK
jgi:hypothetical protein